eukprot:2511256-Rhodomonas_salina.3
MLLRYAAQFPVLTYRMMLPGHLRNHRQVQDGEGRGGDYLRADTEGKRKDRQPADQQRVYSIRPMPGTDLGHVVVLSERMLLIVVSSAVGLHARYAVPDTELGCTRCGCGVQCAVLS